MKFRPCIDIHNGCVKQIVGGSLKDAGNQAKENFISDKDASYYAELYKSHGLKGGHVILLNHRDSEFYEATKEEAIKALKAYPNSLQVGGGINPSNADIYLDAGASHVIVTSYVFNDGKIDESALMRMRNAVSKDKLVLDLSVRKKDDSYYIVTDRWQKFTDVKLNRNTIDELADYCDEFLVHAADVEGLSAGIEKDVVSILSDSKIKVTYAGGIHSLEDILLIKDLGKNVVDITIGSALDIFGGYLPFEEVIKLCN